MAQHWLLRMAQWARHPHSPTRVKLVFGAVAIALFVFGLEYFGFWPDALTAKKMRP